MKYLITLALVVAAVVSATASSAQANCYPQVVATPQGLVTVIVCQ